MSDIGPRRAIELTAAQRERFDRIRRECAEGGRLPPPSDGAMLDSLMDTWDAVGDGHYDDAPQLRTDGGLAITPEELARRKRAPSSTPDEDRPSCPKCGRNHLKFLNNKWGTANGRWYCDECHEHVEPEERP